MSAHPQAFFMKTAAGQRFCLYHGAAIQSRGNILYVHPFAEEMNKTRHMAAEQARQLSAAGWSVLQMDLTGCGDSEGDFGDATWALWQADLRAGWDWLKETHGEQEPCWIWGSRFGALLAADFAEQHAMDAAGLLLWQPVTSGAQHLKQFLRLRTVQNLMSSADEAKPIGKAESVQSLLAELSAGQSLEIAGYRLNPQLAIPMQAMDLSRMVIVPAQIHWLDVASQVPAALAPVSQRLAEAWRQQGKQVNLAVVTGPSFWQTQEIEFCPELLKATCAVMGGEA